MSKKRAAKPKGALAKRIASIEQLPTVVRDDYGKLKQVLNVLKDEDEPEVVRLAALRSLQATSFDPKAFASCRADFIATLRKIATASSSDNLRQRALGILAREKDGMAQRTLLDGLRNPAKAFVTPEKALQLLSYDAHADAYSAARDVVAKPPNVKARREALRVLAADVTAVPMFEKILRDKDEVSEIRLASAAALNALRPDKLQKHAREIVLDKDDYPEIQATSLTALTQFGARAKVTDDASLLKRVDKMKTDKSPKVKTGARRFLAKYALRRGSGQAK